MKPQMIAIIDYGAGNIQSVANALKKLEEGFKVVAKSEELKNASKIILPGVGAAGAAMGQLMARGFADKIPRLRVPFLGICLGLQLLADFSEENNVKCLSVIPGRVKKFPASDLKVPLMGWNKVDFIKNSLLVKNIPDGSFFYFVNSFYFDAPENCTVARTDYGVGFPSIIQKDNFYATQFHPEKSGEIGLKLLKNFCEI